jgi:hypothetical protein
MLKREYKLGVPLVVPVNSLGPEVLARRCVLLALVTANYSIHYV